MHPNKRTSSASQYEPLVAPPKWSGDEKRFVLRLTQLMDSLFEKQHSLARRVSALEERINKEETNG